MKWTQKAEMGIRGLAKLRGDNRKVRKEWGRIW